MGDFDQGFAILNRTNVIPKINAPEQPQMVEQQQQVIPEQQTSDFSEGFKILNQPSQIQTQTQIQLQPQEQYPEGSIYNPIKKSPLSTWDRAYFGWLQTPENQEKYLRKQFADIKLNQKNGESSFVVKDSEGNWNEVDPNFSWKSGNIGTNLRDFPKDVADWAGKYGLRATAAIAAGGAALATAPLSVPLLIGATAVAGVAAAGAQAIDIASRGQGRPGSIDIKDPEDFMHQMNLSMLIGAQEFLGQKAGEAVIGVASKGFRNLLEKTTSQPNLRAVAKNIFDKMGVDPKISESWMRNPAESQTLMKMAEADNLNPDLHRLNKAEDAAVVGIDTQIKGLVSKEGQEFAKLKVNPKVKSAIIKTENSFGTAKQGLDENGFLTKEGVLNPERPLAPADEKAINFILLNSEKKSLSYDETRILTQDIGALLNSNPSNPFIYKSLTELKRNLHQSIIDGIDKESGQVYGNLLQRFGKLKDLKELMGKSSEGSAKFTFLNRLRSEDRNIGNQLVADLIEAGVDSNSIERLFRIQGARIGSKWFQNKLPLGKIAKLPIPFIPGPRTAYRLATGVIPRSLGKTAGTAIEAGGQIAGAASEVGANIGASKAINKVAPYIDQVYTSLHSIPPNSRSQLLQQPETIDKLQSLIQSSTQQEDQMTQQLIQKIPNE